MNEKEINVIEVETNDANKNERQSFDEVVVENKVEKAKRTKKEKNHLKALKLVEKAKMMVDVAHEQNKACKLLLAGDLKEYDEAKASLKKGGLDTCVALLKKLGYSSKNDTQHEDENIVVFEPKEELSPIVLKNVYSGTFTGLMFGLAGGVLSAIGLIYLATEKLGTTIDITRIPSKETIEQTLSWFSTSVGLDANMYVGGAFLALASLSVMAVIYAIRVGLKGSANLHFSAKQLVEAELYTQKKADCKAEMDKVDAHMKETVSMLKMYEVIFNEQKGKLERILHIEGSKAKSSDYHEKSFSEIHETKELIRSIKDFIATPMSQEGKLSEKSIKFLQRAKSQMDKMLERLY